LNVDDVEDGKRNLEYDEDKSGKGRKAVCRIDRRTWEGAVAAHKLEHSLRHLIAVIFVGEADP